MVKKMNKKMSKKLEKILLRNKNLINKEKLERILINKNKIKKPKKLHNKKLESILDRKNIQFENIYSYFRSEYSSTESFARQLLKDNMKLADQYKDLESRYENILNEKEKLINSQKNKIETLSEKLINYEKIKKENDDYLKLIEEMSKTTEDALKLADSAINDEGKYIQSKSSVKDKTESSLIKPYVPKHASKSQKTIDKAVSNYVPRHAAKDNLEEKVHHKGKRYDVDVDLSKYSNNGSGSGYYDRLTSLKPKNPSLNRVIEVLSGDYVKENGKRAWTWEDRENEIKKYYNTNHIEYSDSDKEELDEIIKTVKSNKYARKRHSRKIRNINSVIKTPTEPKLTRAVKGKWRRMCYSIKNYFSNYRKR